MENKLKGLMLIKALYHNARLSGSLNTESEFESDLFQSEMDFHARLKIEDLELEYSDLVEPLGELFQWGRSGATLCFDKLIEVKGGSRFHFNLDVIEALSENQIDRIIQFNKEVKEWCSSAPDLILKELREENKEALEDNKGKRRRSITVYK